MWMSCGSDVDTRVDVVWLRCKYTCGCRVAQMWIHMWMSCGSDVDTRVGVVWLRCGYTCGCRVAQMWIHEEPTMNKGEDHYNSWKSVWEKERLLEARG